ncbi:MAG: hypothetical protein WC717_04340 [Candidatus Micrarchaeia archaeon]|jgi:hypothetical protein
MEARGLISEIESTIGGASGGRKVTLIILAVGKGVSVSKEEIVQKLGGKFPGASIDIREGGAAGSVTVKEIEVK